MMKRSFYSLKKKVVLTDDRTMVEKPISPPPPQKFKADDSTVLRPPPINTDDKTVLQSDDKTSILDSEKTLILDNTLTPKTKDKFDIKVWLKTRDGMLIGSACALSLLTILVSIFMYNRNKVVSKIPVSAVVVDTP